MKKFYSLFFFLCILNITYAGFGKTKNLASSEVNTESITDSVETSEADAVENIAKPETITVCACQVLMLKSNNEKENNVVVFAEKNITGELSSSDKRQLKTIFEKEKAHMKNLFFDKIKLVDEKIVNADCSESIKLLKTTYNNLVVYDILNANVRK